MDNGSGESYVVVYTGSRGSGKSLSMTLWAVLELMRGHRVWSNYQIAFNCIYPDGHEKELSSEPLDMDALYTFDNEMVNGSVFIDEINLWSDSRRSMAVTSRLLNSIMTLIRKRSLRFFFTTQEFTWIDKRMQFQCDMWVTCMDCHYLNRNFKKGAYISQNIRDLSGYFTGHMYNETLYQAHKLFHGEILWGCYNTNQEYDVLKAITPVHLENVRNIKYGDVEGEEKGALLVPNKDESLAFKL